MGHPLPLSLYVHSYTLRNQSQTSARLFLPYRSQWNELHNPVAQQNHLVCVRVFDDKFKSLKQLKIFLDLESMSAPTYGQDLYSHEDTGKLRSQRGLALRCPQATVYLNPFSSKTVKTTWPYRKGLGVGNLRSFHLYSIPEYLQFVSVSAWWQMWSDWGKNLDLRVDLDSNLEPE